jgi:hypothetical protein
MNLVYTRVCVETVSAYWLHQGRLTANSAALIDWQVLASACQAEYLGIPRWVTKYVTGICGDGKWLERWQWQNHS